MSRWNKWCLGLAAGLVVGLAAFWAFSPSSGQSDPAPAPPPVVQSSQATPPEQALERALQLADEARRVLEGVKDYTATFVKQERLEGKLLPQEVIQLKVRHQPFSVYLKHLAPPGLKGQEAIWVQGANDDKIIAHGAGILNVATVRLDPEGTLAMKGNRHSIRHVGLRHLLQELLRLCEEHRQQLLQCRIWFLDEEVDGVPCQVLEVRAPRRWEDFPWAMARIYLDKQKRIPIRYEAYDWPPEGQKDLQLIEHYYYKDLKLNVGLTDKDFDPNNEEYNYPQWKLPF